MLKMVTEHQCADFVLTKRGNTLGGSPALMSFDIKRVFIIQEEIIENSYPLAQLEENLLCVE